MNAERNDIGLAANGCQSIALSRALTCPVVKLTTPGNLCGNLVGRNVAGNPSDIGDYAL
jgi:hypothetical protein